MNNILDVKVFMGLKLANLHLRSERTTTLHLFRDSFKIEQMTGEHCNRVRLRLHYYDYF